MRSQDLVQPLIGGEREDLIDQAPRKDRRMTSPPLMHWDRDLMRGKAPGRDQLLDQQAVQGRVIRRDENPPINGAWWVG